jgi:hypothetical protein
MLLRKLNQKLTGKKSNSKDDVAQDKGGSSTNQARPPAAAAREKPPLPIFNEQTMQQYYAEPLQLFLYVPAAESSIFLYRSCTTPVPLNGVVQNPEKPLKSDVDLELRLAALVWTRYRTI